MFTLIIFIAVLSLLVFVHEAGHFFVARKFGLNPEEFGFGFPPRAFGIYKSKDGKWKKIIGGKEVNDASGTIYSVNWVPLGGFVKLGEDDLEVGENKNHFKNKTILQRALILSAGVGMNIVLASVLISIGFMFGFPQALNGEPNSRAILSDQKIQVVQVLPDSPAQRADLKMFDTILSINGVEFKTEKELQAFVNNSAGNELEYRIQRENKEITKKIIPEKLAETNKAGVGIAITATGLVRYPWYIAIWEGIKTTLFLSWAILIAFFGLIKGLIFGQGLSADVAGPVGIASLTGQMARMGFVYLLQFTAILSINLAIINFLPFPALDGGRILFLIIEKIKGSPVKKEIEAMTHNIGFMLLMILVLVVTFKDISRFGHVFKAIGEKFF